uniref:Eukaryotic translation initiation factor 3 subunit C n=1 Tax=Mucochytrium quahogii TaxID=96639 RepID=A0A7S2S795_9STRA|mmetsp:Transcript_45159/g.72351  ORF Transcript_45159/g.72351 Transcript_45159/m.72351 type:complete len:1003 (+) Transcript_45159:229-3237(+)|eukprot:CAMPEP_0203758566 /NCGR_PEP_ID=MMETSP0098-20131031/11413_1 /ASSEMBLY_ACC=CAM_ASM_000208 /TAXON_ID=96639 /ORGANISM=" , Strain NY0313808BC1" /LENGTH=1002 /DNA_ID=CAMNT_0050651077 /DNA_START=230 /DNA_END=3238 /DNA_ORIENTATION=-
MSAQQDRSKFWAGDESEQSESESDSGSSEEEVDQKVTSRWVESDSESEAEETRVVKSQLDKNTDAVTKAAKDFRNALNINDWNASSEKYKTLKSVAEKAKKANNDRHVDQFLRVIKYAQECISQMTKAKQKQLSKANAKALNKLKNEVKDLIAENKEAIENLPAVQAESSDSESSDSDDSSDSDSSGSSSGSDSDSDSDSDSGSDGSGSESGSEEWDESSSSSSDSDSDDEQLTGRARWVKKAPTDKRAAKEESKKKSEAMAAKRGERAEVRKTQKLQKQMEQRTAQEKTEILSPEQLDARMLALVANRGRKGINRYEQIRKMRKLVNMTLPLGPKKLLPALMHLISAEFDIKSGIDEHMPLDLWRQVLKDVKFVLRLLNNNPKLRMVRIEGEDLGALFSLNNIEKKMGGEQPAEPEKDADVPETDSNNIRVVGDIGSFMERLSEEYNKFLRHTDPHSQDYLDRLSDEGDLVDVSRKVQDYFVSIENSSAASRLCLVSIEHVYYKHRIIACQLVKEQTFTEQYGKREFLHPGCWVGADDPTSFPRDAKMSNPAAWSGSPSYIISKMDNDSFDPEKEINEMCAFMYQYGDSRGQCRAMLCQIYHYAIHNKFYKARDLLLMSRLQDTVHNSDVDTQILYNRMMVQLGLAAFRQELIYEAHLCLQEICGNKKEKELLAQGLGWRSSRDRNIEQEQLEKRRLVPYHMHINLELLDATYLTSAMLLEIPYMASVEFDSKGGFLSKQFRRISEQYSDQVFTGPPENTKDHVLASSQALKEGDWRLATYYLLKLTVWELFPESEKVREMLGRKVKDEALKTYMLTYSSNYDSIKLSYLCELFDMDSNRIHSIISKMMMTGDLNGSWDQPTGSIILHKREPTHLQALSLQFADKVSDLVDGNERLLNFGAFEDGRGRSNRDRDGGYRDGKGRGRGGKDDRGNRGRGRGRNYRTGGYGGNRFQGGRGGFRGGRGGYGGRGGRGGYGGRGGFRPNRNYDRNYGSTRTDRTPI